MSPLFGNKEEKAAQQAAAIAEIERLCGLPVADLAAEILPAWGPNGARRLLGNSPGSLQIVAWLVADYPRKPSIKPLLEPVKEAIQALEHAGLLLRKIIGDGGSTVDLTRLGETALAEGTVRQHLGLTSS
jgi:hypothetical protein